MELPAIPSPRLPRMGLAIELPVPDSPTLKTRYASGGIVCTFASHWRFSSNVPHRSKLINMPPITPNTRKLLNALESQNVSPSARRPGGLQVANSMGNR